MTSRFFEPVYAAGPARMEYLCGIERLIDKKRAEAEKARDRFMAEYPRDLESLRSRFLSMLGWPLDDPEAYRTPVDARFTFLESEEETDFFRVTVEVLPALRFSGLYLRRKGEGKRPLVICQHGGMGSPELICGLYSEGNTYNYRDMARRVLARDVHVFAPQLLVWNQQEYGISFDRQKLDDLLKQLGGSITALEIFCIRRALDALCALPEVDPERIGMVGLSYGGFFTLYTAAAEPRIKSCVAAGCLNEHNGVRPTYEDWCWKDMAHTFMDAEVGALVAPRGLYLQLGTRDELFAESPARREYERLKRYFSRANCPGRLYMEFFDGAHEFSPSDDTITRMIRDLTSTEE